MKGWSTAAADVCDDGNLAAAATAPQKMTKISKILKFQKRKCAVGIRVGFWHQCNSQKDMKS